MKIFSHTCILQIFLYSYISFTFEYIILKVTWWLQQIWFHGMPYVSSSNENLNRVILVSYEEEIYNRAPKYCGKLPAFSLDGSGDSEALKETDEIDKDKTTPQIAKTRRCRLDIDPTLLRWIGIYWTSIRGPCYLGTKNTTRRGSCVHFLWYAVNNKHFMTEIFYGWNTTWKDLSRLDDIHSSLIVETVIQSYLLFLSITFQINSSFNPLRRVTHICVSNLTIIVSDNGLSPGGRQAIVWTNAIILLIGP